jgi:hypothetical protein
LKPKVFKDKLLLLTLGAPSLKVIAAIEPIRSSLTQKRHSRKLAKLFDTNKDVRTVILKCHFKRKTKFRCN